MTKQEPKFKVGETVNYIPYIPGLIDSKFVIDSVQWKEEDDLSKFLNIDFEPTYVYYFKGTYLSAIESDLK